MLSFLYDLEYIGRFSNLHWRTFKHQNHKMVKHTETIRLQQATNYLNVFDYFVGLAVKVLTSKFDFIKIRLELNVFK